MNKKMIGTVCGMSDDDKLYGKKLRDVEGIVSKCLESRKGYVFKYYDQKMPQKDDI